jgi:hypothetical protein
MNRKTKIAVAVAGSACLAAALLVVSPGLRLLFELPFLSHWPQVPPPELYVTTQPKLQDVAGFYHLTQQTITTNGLAVLGGRQCQLDLRPDGSFIVTNYPQWSPDTNSTPYVMGFVATNGTWRFERLGGVFLHGRAKRIWGILFSDNKAGIDPLTLRSNGAPYDLMLTYGDGDEGMFMMFGRQK